ncbi:hypothetical protein JTE90_002767 [Oedothorax gibbosus]|uniref:Uncharacterized protein n=1 Tax=Oedothorax gibbosus TaxID=931172 RepID=A0AAV6ULV5_9ARAC|nr:hypothetical protein JTE90_002767 [Oedothorax gibbosus]
MPLRKTANLLAEWLIMADMNILEVQSIVEDHLRELIIRYFDPKKADSIFTEEGETPAWLTEKIEHHTWRSLIYKLAEKIKPGLPYAELHNQADL